ncbi:hypothetical protein [Clostridium beijerinckii]|uniref:Uncharacterized protein n=1 Tax=Clostridium beijerinckii TaxID=1520 RepID=A0AAW3W3A1_CLOBE|nr:hypothetical protein [Clostridium beijerinckii]MBC2455655.1 hypothetical protein [Clostridium beijerinckii]MBC2473132.1 hypothetical protein [Clostridium beijerinckii]NOV62364.1 hypothetical protein [Clostridium beijerinckii]NOV68139.1 hypothetical protein [Clostridium beijerinckii]NOW30416.1 hypothetical protein [Clostridium beijerinckii]
MSKAIHKKDLRLLEKCEITKQYPILIEIMNRYPDIEKEELKEISDEVYRFFDNIYDRVKRQAIDEWEGTPERDIKQFKKEDKMRCNICNTSIEYVCTIHNKFNGKELNIGRECNKRFEIFSDKDVDSIIRKQKELHRLNELDEKYPKLISILKNWTEFINKEDIYIFEQIKNRYLIIGEKLNQLHKEYTANKNITDIREKEILFEIGQLLIEGEKEKEKIIHFIKNNRNKLLCITKKMVTSLRHGNYGTVGLKWLEEDGEIRLRTLYRFYDDEFSQKLIPEFNNVLKEKGVMIKAVRVITRKNIGYDVILNQRKDCELYIRYDYMAQLCGATITNEEFEDFKSLDIIKEGQLIDTYSIEYGLGLIESILAFKLIEVYEYYAEFKDVIWIVKKEEGSDKAKYYYQTPIDRLKPLLKDLLYNLKKYNGGNMFQLLEKNSRKLPNSDAEDLIKMRDR